MITWEKHQNFSTEENGLTCPICGAELKDISAGVLCSNEPPSMEIVCDECGYTGVRPL